MNEKQKTSWELAIAAAGLVGLILYSRSGGQGLAGSGGGLEGQAGLPQIPGSGGGAQTPTINLDFPAIPPVVISSDQPPDQTKKEGAILQGEKLPVDEFWKQAYTRPIAPGQYFFADIKNESLDVSTGTWKTSTKKEQKSGGLLESLGYGTGVKEGGGLLYKLGILKTNTSTGVTTHSSPTSVKKVASGPSMWDIAHATERAGTYSGGGASAAGGGSIAQQVSATMGRPSILPGMPGSIWTK